MYTHIPVLLNEVLEYLKPAPNQNFVDATLGGGGYSRALLEATAPSGKVLALDIDQAAIDNAKKTLAQYGSRLVLDHRNFRDLGDSINHYEFTSIDGIVADIGLSSFQLDNAGRGLSFQSDDYLDMRFDLSSNQSDASFILNNYSEQQLTEIFQDYGEDKHSRGIAAQIVKSRAIEPIKRTTELNLIIQKALPKPVKHLWQDTARRIYQALRITVNHELANLQRFLPQALNLVEPGGRIAVVAFHSLEDRIVKQFFKEASSGCVCPPEFPICKCGITPQLKVLTKKPITASSEELAGNRRAQPAKLRVAQKL